MFVLRPNRSSSASQLLWVFAAMVGLAASVAGFSVLQGNLWAPLFAVVHLGLVGFCLRLVWLRSGDEDRLCIGEEHLVVARKRGALCDRVSYPTAWVRLWIEETERATGMPRLLVGMRGQATEIGAFLTAEHKRRALQRLLEHLRMRREAPGSTQRLRLNSEVKEQSL